LMLFVDLLPFAFVPLDYDGHGLSSVVVVSGVRCLKQHPNIL